MNIRHFLFLIVLLCSRLEHTGSIVYVVSTDSSGSSCPQDHCRTLNEWIESGTSPFTNESTVMLSPGVHVINTTEKGLFTENGHSVVFTSVESQTTVWCINEFIFEFFDCEDIEVSNIVFKSCALNHTDQINLELLDPEKVRVSSTLLFWHVNHVKVMSVVIVNGGLIIHRTESCMNTTIMLHNLSINSHNIGILFTVQPQSGLDYNCILPDLLYLKNSDLSKASVYMDAQCTDINLQNVSVEQVTLPYFTIKIQHALSVILENITVRNSTPKGLLHVGTIDVEFRGHTLFHGNNIDGGDVGVYFQVEKSLIIYPQSKLEFICNHIIGGSLLQVNAGYDGAGYDVEGYLGELFKSRTSIAFINNTLINGGYVMLIKSSRKLFIHNSELTFENNIIKHEISDHERSIMAVLIFTSSTVSLAYTNMTFLNNSVTHGGIFVVKRTTFIMDNFNATFEYNEGGDGGAMAFYQKSYICLLYTSDAADE